jgi:hypothetical protein
MPKLLRLSSGLLRQMLDEEEALFSFSLREIEGGYVNDFSHPRKIRYTANVLAGLQAADETAGLGWDVTRLVDRFVSRHLPEVTDPADKGMVLHVLATAGHDAQETVLRDLRGLADSRARLLRLDLQQICWMLSGLCTHVRINEDARSAAAAERLFRFLDRECMNRDTLLPYSVQGRWRRSLTSFGGLAYYLKALADYSRTFNDRYSEVIFREAVAKTIILQGPDGEWPWFLSVDQERVMDWYPIYSVHQASMAMLFLLPALDLGVVEARESMVRSYSWLFGRNQLGIKMLRLEPFMTYRCIRRSEPFERGRRYVRALARSALHSGASFVDADRLEVNPECRSYELGWILYAWAGREGFEDFTELTCTGDAS